MNAVFYLLIQKSSGIHHKQKKRKIMSIPNQEIENAILSWISTFSNISTPLNDIENLSDAIALTQVMTEISPEVFDISKIDADVAENWALKLNNLTYLYEKLEKYYNEILGKLFDKTYVDVVKISKSEDKEQLYNLAELVLGAAVQCENKEFYINAILTLDESCQNALMYLIEKILNRYNQEHHEEPKTASESFVDSAYLRSSIGHQNKIDAPMKSLLEKLEELESENLQLGQRVNDLVQEREQLKTRVNDLIQEVNKKAEDVKDLVIAKEGVLEKLEIQESQEDLKNEVKLKDFKINELMNFVEDLKQKNQMDITLLQEELEEQKRKVGQLSKVEGTIDWYKKKYDDYSKLTAQMTEMDKKQNDQRSKIDELTAYNESLISKINIYREKIEAEKTKNITLEIEMNKKSAAIEALKADKKRLENLNTQLEHRLQDQSRAYEKQEREYENIRNLGASHTAVDNFLEKFSGQDFQEIITALERENEDLKSKQFDKTINEDGEVEILKQENEILKNKCKQIELENEEMKRKVSKSEDVKFVEKLTTENTNLKQEAEKARKAESAAKLKAQIEIKSILESQAKISEPSIAFDFQKDDKPVEPQSLGSESEDLERIKGLNEANQRLQERITSLTNELNELVDAEKRREDEIRQDMDSLKDEISEKIEITKQLNERIIELQARAENTQSLERELKQRDEHINALVDDIDAMKHIIQEVGERKEEELKLVVTSLHELAIRSVDLEREIMTLQGGSFVTSSKNKNKGLIQQGSKRV